MPRALRLGSMGVRVAAACVGMMYGPNVPIVAIVFSGGAILAYCLELLLSAWLSRLPTYSPPPHPSPLRCTQFFVYFLVFT